MKNRNQNRKGTSGTCLKCEGCPGEKSLRNLHGITIRGGRVALRVSSPGGNKLVRPTQLYGNHVCSDINETLKGGVSAPKCYHVTYS